MNKSNIIIGLGSLSALIGVWFFFHERSYAATDRACYFSSCLAETLQWVGIGQALLGVAVVLIGLILKDQ
jgi:hypothetical protein